MELYERFTYTADIDRLISVYIREYDLSKANINMLYKYKVLNEAQYNMYYTMDKIQREISIGLLIGNNPEYNLILQNGIKESKRLFFEANDIREEDVLSIKNDAIFVINKIPTITKFDNNTEFSLKNVYTSFYKLEELELYYFFDVITNTEKLDIKGISEYKLLLHNDYFLEFLKVTFNSAQVYPIQDTIDIVISFYTKYIGLALDKGYYREFNSESMFRLNPVSTYYSSYGIDTITDNQITSLNINYNLNLIRKLHQIYSGIYFSSRR